MSENGKGDGTRPRTVPKEVADANHERTFGKFIPWWERRQPIDDTPAKQDDPQH